MSEGTKQLFDMCVQDARSIISERGHNLNPETQVKNVFAYSASSTDFRTVITSAPTSPEAIELRAQIRYICDLGLDTAKGRKLVYVKTRNANLAAKGHPADWHVFPDIQESYHALIHLMVKAGAVKTINVLHTYQNYPVEYSGAASDVPVVKSWTVPPTERGAYTGCFVVLAFPDGTISTSYHHAQDIRDTHQKFSKGGSTWKSHEQAMMAKSAILDAVRYVPVFDSVVAKAVEHYDQSMEYESVSMPYTGEQKAKFDNLISAGDSMGLYLYQSECRPEAWLGLNKTFKPGEKVEFKTLVATLVQEGFGKFSEYATAATDLLASGDSAGLSELVAELSMAELTALTDELGIEFAAAVQKLSRN